MLLSPHEQERLLLAGGTGPAEGTKATTVTPGADTAVGEAGSVGAVLDASAPAVTG